MARADTSFIYTRPTCGLDPKVFQTTLGGGVWYIYTCMKKISIQSHSFARWLRSYCSHRSKSCLLKMSADVLWKRLIAEQLWVTVFTPELIQRRTLFVFNRGELFFFFAALIWICANRSVSSAPQMTRCRRRLRARWFVRQRFESEEDELFNGLEVKHPSSSKIRATESVYLQRANHRSSASGGMYL